jgi:WD40 repeat protein
LREAGSWLIESFRPNKQPFYELAAASIGQLEPELGKTDKTIKAKELAESIRKHGFTADVSAILKDKPGKGLLLVVDQFEELYTGCEATEQQQFVDALLAAIESASRAVTLVLTLRADFYSYVVNHPPFTEAFNHYPAKNITLMKAEEMQAAIELPAEKMGVKLEEGLTQRILDDVKQEPGNLPLLEFALTQLWEKQSRGLLTHQAYSEIGGVARALSNHAEAVYGKLSEEEQKQAQRIFIQLVRPGEGTEDTRRTATRAEVRNWNLVTFLAGEDARLVVTGCDEQTKEKTVEVMHEALIREWGRLREWIESDRTFLTWRGRLRMAMHQWQISGKQEGYLLQGAPLGEAEGWLEKRREELSSTEQEFIALSKDEKQRRELKELEAQVALDTATERNQILAEANQERDRRIRRGNITLGVTSVLAFLVITLTSIYALQKFREAQEAQEGTKLEQAGVNALRQMPSGEIEALLSAIQAGQKLKQLIQDGRLPKDYPATSPLLALQKILDTIHEQNQINAGQGGIRSVSFSPDGQTIATAGEDDTISLWSLSGEKKWTRKGVQLEVADSVKTMSFVAFSPDGKKIVAAEGDGTITLWDLSGKQLTQFKAPTTNFKSLSFSPDGKKIATADEETARLWDLSGKQLAQFVGHKGRVNSIGFSPTGQQIATAGYDGTVRLWDLLGKQLTQFKAHNGQEILSVSFSPDGKYLATAAKDNTARIWNLSGQEQVKLEGHQGWVLNVSFSHDGKRLATTSDDGTARIWDFSGNPIATLQGHRGVVSRASFSPDGRYLVTGANDDTVRIWNLSHKPAKQFTGHKSDVNSISFRPTGQQIVTADHQGKVILWNQSGQQQAQWQADFKGSLWSVSFSPDGQLIATGGYDNMVAIWDSSGKLKTRLKGHKAWISSISFSPNGQMILTSGADNTAKLWNLSGKLLATLSGHQDVVYRVSFSPDGQMIATGAWDGTIRLWDLSGHQVKQWQTKQRQISGLSFSSSGKQLATADNSSVVKIWDLSGKQQLEFFSYQSGVNSLSFNPKGNYLATGGMDGTVRLWDSQGRQIAEFNTEKGAVLDIKFSPDGKSIIAGGDNGTVQLWQIKQLDKLLAQGCQWLQYYRKNNEAKMKNLKICS